jgi:hypothetical protein
MLSNLQPTITVAYQSRIRVKHHLNVDEMVRHLCAEIRNGYTNLFQLLPHVDEDGIVSICYLTYNQLLLYHISLDCECKNSLNE